MGSNPIDSESFCLKWNDYASNISLAFRDLRKQSDFFDVTLLTKDGTLSAHKVILSACSDFFRDSLKRMQPRSSLSGHPMAIYLRGVSKHQLQSILEFMYQGEVNVTNDDLTEFLAVAEELQVKGLTNKDDSSEASSSSAPPPPKPVQPSQGYTPSSTSQTSNVSKRSLTPSTSKGISQLSAKKPKTDEIPDVTPTFVESHNIKQDPEIILDAPEPVEVNAEEDYESFENYYEDEEDVADGSVTSDQGQTDSNQANYPNLILLEDGRTRCEICNKLFSTTQSGIAHTVRTHQEPLFIECCLCKKIVKHVGGFRCHIIKAHKIKGRNSVESYGKIVPSPTYFIDKFKIRRIKYT